jgi:hypothetical protein
MKYIVSLILVLLVSATSFAQARGSQFKFVKETHDFGTLKEGGEAIFEFVFVNSGNEPLIIDGVSASCGCTVPSFNHEPVLPNQKGSIKVKFNTTGKNGSFAKTVYVKSNVPTEKEKYELFIKGVVVPR